MRKLLLLALVCGCGGASVDSVSGSHALAGRWEGTFWDRLTSDTGSLVLTVAPDGSVTGQSHNDVTGDDGAWKGSFDKSLVYKGTVDYDGGSSQSTGRFGYTERRSWQIGALLDERYNGKLHTVIVDLKKQ